MTPLVGTEPKDPRPRIAGLRLRRDRADLGKAEAQTKQRIWHFGMLVEARRNADRIGKVQSKGRTASRLSSGDAAGSGANCNIRMISRCASSGSSA